MHDSVWALEETDGSLFELETGTFWLYGCEFVHCAAIRVYGVTNLGRIILTECAFMSVRVGETDYLLDVRGSRA
jgi:hypothetical protein